MKGLFWNYISVGIDAKAAYNFHSLREARPWAASGRLVNQAWYAYFSLRTGWFCAAAPIARKLKLKARLFLHFDGSCIAVGLHGRTS